MEPNDNLRSPISRLIANMLWTKFQSKEAIKEIKRLLSKSCFQRFLGKGDKLKGQIWRGEAYRQAGVPSASASAPGPVLQEETPLHQQLDPSPLRLPGCSVSNPERCAYRGRSALPGANRAAGPRSASAGPAAAETGTELGLGRSAAQLLPPSADCGESCAKEKRCVQERINHAMLC